MSIHLTDVVAPGSGGTPRGAPHGRPLAIWGNRARLIIYVRGETLENARFQPNLAPVRPPIGNATSGISVTDVVAPGSGGAPRGALVGRPMGAHWQSGAIGHVS